MRIKLLDGVDMIKQLSKTVFLSLIFLFGVVIGGIKTPDIVSYAKAIQNGDVVEKQDTQKKNKPLPKRLRKSKRIA